MTYLLAWYRLVLHAAMMGALLMWAPEVVAMCLMFGCVLLELGTPKVRRG